MVQLEAPYCLHWWCCSIPVVSEVWHVGSHISDCRLYKDIKTNIRLQRPFSEQINNNNSFRVTVNLTTNDSASNEYLYYSISLVFNLLQCFFFLINGETLPRLQYRFKNKQTPNSNSKIQPRSRELKERQEICYNDGLSIERSERNNKVITLYPPLALNI